MLFIPCAKKNIIYICSRSGEFYAYIFTVRTYYRNAFLPLPPSACINVSIIFRGGRTRLQEHEFLVHSVVFIRVLRQRTSGSFFPVRKRASKNPKLTRGNAVCLNKSERVSKVFRFLSGTTHTRASYNWRGRARYLQSEKID